MISFNICPARVVTRVIRAAPVLTRPQSYCRDEMRVMSVGRQNRKALFIGTFA
jgi:hypothetical protein